MTKILPIGSVLKIQDATVMVVGHFSKAKENKNQYYYLAVEYPRGYISQERTLYVACDCEDFEVLHEGYQSEYGELHTQNISKLSQLTPKEIEFFSRITMEAMEENKDKLRIKRSKEITQFVKTIDSNDGLLGLGTIVTGKGGNQPLMIVGYLQNKNGKVYDYIGVPYPTGWVSNKSVMGFNQSVLDKLVTEGYKNEEGELFLKALPRLVSGVAALKQAGKEE